MKAELRRGLPFYGEEAPKWGLARFIKAGPARIVLALWRVRVIGAENLPEGGAILSANHVSLLDSVIMWCTRLPKQPHFVAKSELYKVSGLKGRLLAWFIDSVGAMPVERGTADRLMINRATDLLKKGEWVAIFPEGTRVRGGSDPSAMGEALGGAAYLAQRTSVPIVPIGIAGTDEINVEGKVLPRFPQVTFLIGEPIYPDRFEGRRKEKVQKITDELMISIRRLRDEAREL
ncbi:MAG: 1-acyl-sn-glycerol-3-phosphate acyltransferase [Coriobacteriia bacterium]|nr:1-acyl-sn-glycerol-3-phosphate acyltransferase [Coriobacteriia bacterium]